MTVAAVMFGAGRVARANTYTVTTTANTGAGSLRKAITDANANAGADSITFNITGTGPFVIAPTSALPTITGTVSIDATTQPGWSGQPVVELDGSNAGSAHGLVVLAVDCTISGLAIHSFTASSAGNGIRVQWKRATISQCWIGLDSSAKGRGCWRGIVFSTDDSVIEDCVVAANTSYGVMIDGGAGRDVIVRSKIGTDPTGALAIGNGTGVYIADADCTLGGSSADRNVISGNTGYGVWVTSSGGSRVLIADNYIGCDATGSFALGNTDHGILVNAGADDANILRNVVSANRGDGIYVVDGSVQRAVIEDNYFGLNAQGDTGLGNGVNGIEIRGATDVHVARNIASANLGGGITVSGTSTTSNNVIEDNIVGLDATGSYRIGNYEGITMGQTAAATTVQRNVVSGNRNRGIVVSDNGTTRNSVLDNLVGTDVTGSVAVGNSSYGVHVINADSSVIRGNVITASGSFGIRVETNNSAPTAGRQNRIESNAIFRNGWNGIAIGASTNDPLDVDTGANELQNHPVFKIAVNDWRGLHVYGNLPSAASTTYEIQLFGCTTTDAEGEVLLATFNVTTDPAGNAPFYALVANWPLGLPITATATDPLGNTSEFGVAFVSTLPWLPVPLPPPPPGPPYQR